MKALPPHTMTLLRDAMHASKFKALVRGDVWDEADAIEVVVQVFGSDTERMTDGR